MGKRIRVLYDSFGFNERVGGVSRYFAELITHLPSDVRAILPFDETCNYYLNRPPFNLTWSDRSYDNFLKGWSFRGKNRLYDAISSVLPEKFRGVERRNEAMVEEWTNTGAFDILHLTGPHYVGKYWERFYGIKPIVVTIHDLIPERLGCSDVIRKCRSRALRMASQIIAVSESTKNDILQLYDVRDDRIKVVYHGVSIPDCTADINTGIYGRYILHVGKRTGYKNFEFFLKAVSQVLVKDRGLKVICTGGGLSTAEMNLAKRLRVLDQVIGVFASDEELTNLYRCAICFVTCSLYEGFCMPILEAFANGCPVLVPDDGCFPEIGGDAALYFNHQDAYDLISKVQLICTSSAIRNKQVIKGFNRAKLFSWKNASYKTYEIYREAQASL